MKVVSEILCFCSISIFWNKYIFYSCILYIIYFALLCWINSSFSTIRYFIDLRFLKNNNKHHINIHLFTNAFLQLSVALVLLVALSCLIGWTNAYFPTQYGPGIAQYGPAYYGPMGMRMMGHPFARGWSRIQNLLRQIFIDLCIY